MKNKFNDTGIPWSSSCNYIGFFLDQRLNFKQHIYTTRKKYREAKNKWFPLLAEMVIYLKNKLILNASFFFTFSFIFVVPRYLWKKKNILNFSLNLKIILFGLFMTYLNVSKIFTFIKKLIFLELKIVFNT